MDQIQDIPDLTAVMGDDDACLTKLRPMLRIADMLPNFPMTSDEVNQLSRENGFDTTVELLEGWARSGMVPDVRIRSGRFVWYPQNVLVALTHADTWRRWIPLHPRHLHKMSAVELEEGRATAAGSSVFTDLDVFDCCAFIEILARTSDPKMRETFSVAFKSKLRKLGVLDR